MSQAFKQYPLQLVQQPQPALLLQNRLRGGNPAEVLMEHSPLVLGIAEDLYDLVEASWLVVTIRAETGFRPLQAMGNSALQMDSILRAAESVPNGIDGIWNYQETKPRDALSASQLNLLCPVRADGRIAGVVAIGAKKDGKSYTSVDHDLIRLLCAHLGELVQNRLLAARVSAKLKQMQRTHMDVKTAREVQNHFLPSRNLPIEGFTYFGKSEPASEVGGDLFEFVRLPNDGLAAAIGDVSGKGIASALLMTGIQATLRSLKAKAWLDLEEMLGELNRVVWELSPDNFFAGLFCAQLDPVAGKLHYINAGHEPALLFTPSTGRAKYLRGGGTVLGLGREASFQRLSANLEPGDMLIAFTDGISEATDRQGKEFTSLGVVETLRKLRHLNAEQAVGHLFREVKSYAEVSSEPDDRTVVVVQYNGGGG